MKYGSDSASEVALHKRVLTLLPVRRLAAPGTEVPCRGTEGSQVTKPPADLFPWDADVSAAADALRADLIPQAVALLQRAQRDRNRWESLNGSITAPRTAHWVVLSACSLVTGEWECASRFAACAAGAAERTWQEDLRWDCRDSGADVSTLQAVCELVRQLPDQAARTLESAIPRHRAVGDMEQLAADHMLLALCCQASGSPVKLTQAMEDARRGLEELDPERHLRRTNLFRFLAWMDQSAAFRRSVQTDSVDRSAASRYDPA